MAEEFSGSNETPTSRWTFPALVAAVTLLCFAPVLGNGFVDWDDFGALRDNPHFRGLGPDQIVWAFTNFRLGHYQPLSWLSFGVDYLLWGMNPLGYHLTGLVLHGINAVLCYLLIDAVLLRAGGATRPATRHWAAVAGALLFALHPLRVESVAWVAIRGHLISSAFAMLVLLVYLRRGRSTRVALALFLCSLLAKATAATLPVVLLVVDYSVLRRFDRERAGAVLVEKIPWFVLVGVFLLLALLAQNTAGALLFGGTVPYGPERRALQAGYGLCLYLAKTLAPLALSPLYPLEQRLVSPGPIFYACALVAVGITWAALILRRRHPGLLAAWVCYVVLVSPVLGFAQSGVQIAADRYTYLACMPWAVLLALVLLRLASAPRLPASLRRGVALVLAIALALLGTLTLRQIQVWRDSITLWNRVVELHPRSGLAHYYRANSRREAADLEGAIADYTRALELQVPLQVDAYNNRGIAWQARGDSERAVADISEAIRIKPEARLYLNRGSARVRDDVPAAIADWSEAIRRDPELVDAYHARGAAREATGQLAAAVADYRTALEKAGPHWPGRADATRRLAALRPRPDRR